MRSAERASAALACLIMAGQAFLPAQALSAFQQQRYCMGTIFNVIVYHPSIAEARFAVERALTEIVRLDGILSHYDAESDLSRLNRDARRGVVSAEPSLYEVIDLSLDFSRGSGGRFDVTIAPLLRTWKQAHEGGRTPSAEEIAGAARCVGYRHIETLPPDRVRFHSDCLELDLGGIGKGYAVDRALTILRSAGIRHALVNAGGSTIAAIGAPPGRAGWPVQLAASVAGSTTLMLSEGSISTSQQSLMRGSSGGRLFGEIVDPQTGAPIQHTATVSVVMTSATASDALSTALLMMPIAEGMQLLDRFGDAAALWISSAGEVQAAHRASGLQLAASR